MNEIKEDEDEETVEEEQHCEDKLIFLIRTYANFSFSKVSPFSIMEK